MEFTKNLRDEFIMGAVVSIDDCIAEVVVANPDRCCSIFGIGFARRGPLGLISASVQALKVKVD